MNDDMILSLFQSCIAFDGAATLLDNVFLKEFFDLNYRIPKQAARRVTRHAASHVDFRADCDMERIPDDENTRRKCRSKPQHFPICHQSIRDNTSSKADNLRFKNREKLEAALNQHLDYSTKISNSATKNIHERKSRPSSRKQTFHRLHNNYQQSDAYVHRCEDHNDLENYEDIEAFECPRADSRIQNILHSDDATEENDFRISCGPINTKICKDFNFRWNSPPAEPHLEPQTDSSPDQRRRKFEKLKPWHFGQGENILDEYPMGESKPWTESSTRAKHNWQYERDKKELKDLCEGVQRFAKRKGAGCRKQQREEPERDEDSHRALEKINRFLSKLPKSRQRNSDRVSKNVSSERHQSLHKSTMEETKKRQSRKSAIDTNNGVDKKVGEINSDEELYNIQVEPKENDETSETEEEARQLAKNESEIDSFARKIEEIYSELIVGNKKREGKKVETDFEKSVLPKGEIDINEGCNGKKKNETKASKQNYYGESDSSSGRNEDECMEEKKIVNNWERCRGNKETEDKTCGALRRNCKSSIGEMIDKGLSYEMKRGKSGMPWEINKTVRCDLEVSEKLPSEGIPVEILPGECYSKSRNSRDSEKTRKNRRLMYLKHIQSDLDKLFDLERCSPERHSSLPIVTTDLDTGVKVTKSPEKKYTTNERIAK